MEQIINEPFLPVQFVEYPKKTTGIITEADILYMDIFIENNPVIGCAHWFLQDYYCTFPEILTGIIPVIKNCFSNFIRYYYNLDININHFYEWLKTHNNYYLVIQHPDMIQFINYLTHYAETRP